MLPHMLPYIISKFSMVLGLFAKRYPALLSNLWKTLYQYLKKDYDNAW